MGEERQIDFRATLRLFSLSFVLYQFSWRSDFYSVFKRSSVEKKFLNYPYRRSLCARPASPRSAGCNAAQIYINCGLHIALLLLVQRCPWCYNYFSRTGLLIAQYWPRTVLSQIQGGGLLFKKYYVDRLGPKSIPNEWYYFWSYPSFLLDTLFNRFQSVTTNTYLTNYTSWGLFYSEISRAP
jgi:hypothetical protein